MSMSGASRYSMCGTVLVATVGMLLLAKVWPASFSDFYIHAAIAAGVCLTGLLLLTRGVQPVRVEQAMDGPSGGEAVIRRRPGLIVAGLMLMALGGFGLAAVGLSFRLLGLFKAILLSPGYYPG